MKFYKCSHCGNIITLIESAGVPVVCCGEKMQELVANTVEAAVEKHTPVIQVEGSKVTITVGSVAHPMTEEHHIAWIALQTKQGCQLKYLDKTGAPSICFTLCESDELVTAFAYCNLHGLWKADA